MFYFDVPVPIGGETEAKVAHEELVRLSRHAASRPRG
jgi:hypothetical protein